MTSSTTQDARKRRALLREIDDGLLIVIMPAQMLQGYLPALLHELLGIALGALVVWHVILHRGWFAALGRGSWTAFRVCDVLLALGTLACLAVAVVSGLVMGDLLGPLLGFALSSPARAVHLLTVHLGFVLMAAHAGWALRISHAAVLSRRDVSRGRNVGAILLTAALCVVGIWAFVSLGYGRYLVLDAGFAFVDTSVPAALYLAKVLLAAIPFGVAGFLLNRALA